MAYEYFKRYDHNIDLSLTVNGGDATKVLTSTFLRGSAGGFFAEEMSANLLIDHLNHVPAKGYDFISKLNGRPVECKAFNRNGVDLAPSDMKGKGRSFDKQRFIDDARTKDFIVCDTSNLSCAFSFVILPGDYVADVLGNKVTARNRATLFASTEEPRPVNW